jgi:hypothetical protein
MESFMRRLLIHALAVIALAAGPGLASPAPALAPALVRWGWAERAEPDFDAHFTARTMRLDYFHTGGRGTEIVSLDRVVADGAWAGSRTRLVDGTNLGKYRFKVIHPETGEVLYSRGFASIYGEWETTPEARTTHRTFHESLRFPWPKHPVRIVLERRDAQNAWQELWTAAVDPASVDVNPADRPPVGRVWTLFENGPPATKVDLLILGEGYTAAELEKFHADARRMIDTLFNTEPFRSRRADFNVRALDLPSAESGVHRPQSGIHRRTPLGVQYNIFGSERYVLTLDNRALRDAAAAAPYEFVVILVNDDQYGGGGIFNEHATVAVDSDFAEYVFIHEFGHHFAGLADEYYTSDVAYETGKTRHVEPWEPNITALHDPARLKWRDLVEPGTPLPTPWGKAAYEALGREIGRRRGELLSRGASPEELGALFQEQSRREAALFAAEPHAGKVGAFEGAGYETRGLYRPELDCIMFSRNPVPFCEVCRRAIERIIELYAA